MRFLSLIAAVGALGATPHTHVILGDTSVGGIHLARTTFPQARQLFPHVATRVIRKTSGDCVVTWQGIGLTVDFGILGQTTENPCTKGTAFVVRVTNRPAWRTAKGLRVGDGVPRLHRLYPHRRLHTAAPWPGYWLVARRLCAEVGGEPYPALRARIRNGRVSAFVVQAGTCE
jgi:hypothetical protein